MCRQDCLLQAGQACRPVSDCSLPPLPVPSHGAQDRHCAPSAHPLGPIGAGGRPANAALACVTESQTRFLRRHLSCLWSLAHTNADAARIPRRRCHLDHALANVAVSLRTALTTALGARHPRTRRYLHVFPSLARLPHRIIRLSSVGFRPVYIVVTTVSLSRLSRPNHISPTEDTTEALTGPSSRRLASSASLSTGSASPALF